MDFGKEMEKAGINLGAGAGIMDPMEWDGVGADLFGTGMGIGTGLEVGSVEQRNVLGEDYRLTGSIYPKKDYLSPSIDQKVAKTKYEALYNKIESTNASKEVPLIKDKNGTPENTGKTFTLTDSFSQKALMALDFDAYLQARKDAYTVNLQSRKVEYFTMANVARIKAGDYEPNTDSTAQDLQDKGVVSADGNIVVIKPSQLIELALATGTDRTLIRPFDITAPGQETDIGFMTVKGVYNKDNKVVFKPVYFDMDLSSVTHFGDFQGIIKVPNRSYEGEAPAHIAVITDAEKIAKFAPHLDPRSLKLAKVKTREQAKAEGKNSVKQSEEIPYEILAPELAKLGVTEAMLAKIRQAKSSSRASNKDIRDTFTEAQRLYRESQTTVNSN